MGTGVLAQPLAMQTSGVAGGWVPLLLAALAAALSGDVLVRCTHEQEGSTRSWAFLLGVHLGTRAGMVMDIIVLLFGSGVSVMYFLFIFEFVNAILVEVGSSALPRTLLAAISGVVVLPLSLPSDLGNMQWLAVAVSCAIAAVALLLLVALGTCNGPDEPVQWLRLEPRGLLRSFGLFLFAFMYHMNLFTVYSALRAPHQWGNSASLRREDADLVHMRRVVRAAVLGCLAAVGLVAETGAVLWRSSTQANVVTNFSRDVCPAAVVYGAMATQAALIASAAFCIPLNLLQTRASLLGLLGAALGTRVESALAAPPWRHLLTACLVAGFAAIAAVMKSVAAIIGVLSGSLGTALMFVLPAFFYKRSGLDGRFLRACTLAGLSVAAVAGLCNAALLTLGM